MRQYSKDELKRQSSLLKDTCGELAAHVSAQDYACIGVYAIDGLVHGGTASIWIETQTDADRDRFLQDKALHKALRIMLRERGYDADLAYELGVTAESQETVDRDWDGDWHHAMR